MNNKKPSPAELVLKEPTEQPKTKFREKFSTFFLFLGAFVAALLLNTFVFQSYEVDGRSMEPTLQNNDRLIIYKLDRTISSISRKPYIPHRGDVVVFHKPSSATEQLIKRVVGLPGDRVVVKNEKITIYNTQNPNGFNPDDAPYGAILPPTSGNVDVTVKEGEIFVCGDNRIPGASLDSRSVLGNVPVDKIVGKLVFRYLPIGNFMVF